MELTEKEDTPGSMLLKKAFDNVEWNCQFKCQVLGSKLHNNYKQQCNHKLLKLECGIQQGNPLLPKLLVVN